MFRFRAPFVAAAVGAGLQITTAAEREMPKFDITVACRGSGSVQTPAKCMQDEQAARDQLAKLWRNSSNQMLHVAFKSQQVRRLRPVMLNCLHACRQQRLRIRPKTPSDLSRQSRNN
jgi:hypothetical protein